MESFRAVYHYNCRQLSVTLTSEGADRVYIFADAIKWYRTDGSDEVIVDDQNATYAGTSTDCWDARYGTSYRYHNSGTGTDKATWTPNIPSGGTYSVYAWWHANTGSGYEYVMWYTTTMEDLRIY